MHAGLGSNFFVWTCFYTAHEFGISSHLCCRPIIIYTNFNNGTFPVIWTFHQRLCPAGGCCCQRSCRKGKAVEGRSNESPRGMCLESLGSCSRALVLAGCRDRRAKRKESGRRGEKLEFAKSFLSVWTFVESILLRSASATTVALKSGSFFILDASCPHDNGLAVLMGIFIDKDEVFSTCIAHSLL